MTEFTPKQYAQSAVEVSITAVKEAAHLTHCLIQLGCMAVAEYVYNKDHELADACNGPDDD